MDYMKSITDSAKAAGSIDYKKLATDAGSMALDAILNSHYQDVDEQLKKLKSKKDLVKNGDKELLEILAKGADYSNLVYDFEKLCNNLDDATELAVLSEEFKILDITKSEKDKEPNQPDVVAFISKKDESKTMWVVARGTVTLTDMLTDILWLADSTFIGGLNLPTIPLQRAEASLKVLLEFITKNDPKQINFCGHSLGGAISGTIFYLYNLRTKKAISSKLITVGSPQLLKTIPDHIELKDVKIDMKQLAKNVHNIIQRVDLIPRIVAPNALPQFLSKVPVVGTKIAEIEKFFSERGNPRNGFQCFGSYYSLNPTHKSRKTLEMKLVDGAELLNVFNSDLKYMAASLSQFIDHDSLVTASSLLGLTPSYQNMFNMGECRKIKDNPLPFPEKYRKSKGSSNKDDSPRKATNISDKEDSPRQATSYPKSNQVAQAPSGTADKLDTGVSRNVEELSETPSMFVQRLLGSNENIIGNFDCKFPSQFLPVWKIISLCIVTCGLYGLVLMYRAFLRFCYRWRCMTPNLVGFQFGKMAVTDKGRIICWSETVIQVKAPKSNNTSYSIVNDTRVYLLNDIKQITQYFASDAACIFCCLDYSCGIELSFNEFNHGVSHLTIAPSSMVKDEIGRPAAAAVSSASRARYYGWARSMYGSIRAAVESTEQAAGISSNLNVLYIVSSTADRNHNGDVKSVLKDLTLLHQKVMSLLPNLNDAVVKTDIDVKKMNLNSDRAHDFSLTKLNFTDKFTNVTIVANDGTVGIPDEWMPLMPGEEVLATTGQVYRMDCMQWVWSIITCGVYYCMHMRRRKYTRSAIVLTNKRIISMDIFERSGTIPLTLSNFSVQVRSYILHEINSGYIASDNALHLSCGVETPNGFIFIEFPGTGRAALPFAMMLQMSIKRSQIKVNLDKFKKNIQDDRTLEWELLPLMDGEKPIDWIRGTKTWEPFCSNPLCLKPYNDLRANMGLSTVDNICSNESISEYLFPVLPYICSCFLRPFQNNCDIVFTNTSVIRFARSENYGVCGFPYFVTKDRFIISWESLSAFSGFNILITASGNETCLNRCCRHMPCGAWCCPIGTASVDVGLDFKGNYGFVIGKTEVNKNWLKDSMLKDNTEMLSNIQFTLQEHYADGAVDSPEVQKMYRKL